MEMMTLSVVPLRQLNDAKFASRYLLCQLHIQLFSYSCKVMYTDILLDITAIFLYNFINQQLFLHYLQKHYTLQEFY